MSDDPDCVGMCAIDDDVCTGCGRTLDQINRARGGEEEEEPPPSTGNETRQRRNVAAHQQRNGGGEPVVRPIPPS